MSSAELDREQQYISVLYARLDDLRERASRRMAGVLRQTGGTPQARVERDTFSAMYRQQLAQLDAAENGLCFGRLEFNDGELRYVGRIGIHADTDDYAISRRQFRCLRSQHPDGLHGEQYERPLPLSLWLWS